MNTVKLKHAIARHGNKVVHFYDGMLIAYDGIIEVPVDREHWIKRLWMTGYNLTPSGERLWTWQQVLELAQGKPTIDEPKPTKKKKKEDADEGADSGRQPVAEDGVRQGEPTGSESIPE